MIISQEARLVVDKRWLAILGMAVLGMSLDQVTTSYAVAGTADLVETNPFLQYLFTVFPKPWHLVSYGLIQAGLVMSTITLMRLSCPKEISYNKATAISFVIAALPLLAGINNVFVLLDA